MESDKSIQDLPYWLVNVPPELRPSTCPSFLQNVNERDRRILSTPDSEYHRLSWPEVQEYIRINRIDLFQRLPSDLRRYRGFIAKITKDHGTVMNFVMNQRLQWRDTTPSAPPFQNASEYPLVSATAKH